MTYETLLVERKGPVATVTLNRPEKLNVLSTHVIPELRRAWGEVARDPEVRVIVLTGAGRAFSAGGDIGEMVPGETSRWEALVREYLECVAELRRLPLPTVARLNGDAVGGGLCLAMACDFRLAVRTARLGVPFVKIGLSASDMGATWFLPRLVGRGKAAELLMTGDVITTEEGERLGLVNRAVPPEEFDATVSAFVERLAAGPPFALRMTKEALVRSLDTGMDEEFDFETLAQTVCLTTEDHREGVRAFKERRKPVFQGR